MTEAGTSVTLIFYQVGKEWYKEPALNLLAAAAQGSAYTHVEIAIGETPGQNGLMRNVARVFNDSTGVEVCERTGRNPCYSYLSLGCSRVAEARMLQFARAQIGKPFSNAGMARSLVWPRVTDGKSYFCAELVAAILKHGGLMCAFCASHAPEPTCLQTLSPLLCWSRSQDSNPGAATPCSLYKLYKKQAAATANPWALRQATTGLSLQSVVASSRPATAPARSPTPLPGAPAQPPAQPLGGSARRRSDSPPRASFRLLAAGESKPLTLSLNSLR
jgi:hypothetical protein